MRSGALVQARTFISVLRHKGRLMSAVEFFNREPVVHTWTYKLDKAA
jgi:hypothetical protein